MPGGPGQAGSLPRLLGLADGRHRSSPAVERSRLRGPRRGFLPDRGRDERGRLLMRQMHLLVIKETGHIVAAAAQTVAAGDPSANALAGKDIPVKMRPAAG